MAKAPYPLIPSTLERSWLERHPRWKIPLGCLVVVALLAAFVGFVFAIVGISFHRSDVFREAIARAERNPEVMRRIGTPLHPGWLPQGQISVSGSAGKAAMSIPVTGPRGKARIVLDASKSEGIWRFKILQVQFEDDSTPIDLLEEGRGLREQ